MVKQLFIHFMAPLQNGDIIALAIKTITSKNDC